MVLISLHPQAQQNEGKGDVLTDSLVLQKLYMPWSVRIFKIFEKQIRRAAWSLKIFTTLEKED